MRQVGEPSVEEILDSIKKVIARDNREAADEQRRERENLGVSAKSVESEEVLELSADAALESVAEVNEEEENEDESLIAEHTRNSMRESLAALSMLSQPSAPPQIVRSGETSLEGLTRELLRPMLAEWLDKNLPPLVESLVAAEIARIAGKKR